jgi:putative transposase
MRAALRAAIEKVRLRYPFTINAWVLLPDHFHTIWTLPPDAAAHLSCSLVQRGNNREVCFIEPENHQFYVCCDGSFQ